jgi:hypothetical protein
LEQPKEHKKHGSKDQGIDRTARFRRVEDIADQLRVEQLQPNSAENKQRQEHHSPPLRTKVGRQQARILGNERHRDSGENSNTDIANREMDATAIGIERSMFSA